MKTEQYIRKPFPVGAVQVTEANFEEVAKWCEGQIKSEDGHAGQFIKVKVNHPLSERQTKAFISDWVLSSHTGFKVYTAEAFERNFELVAPKPTPAHVVGRLTPKEAMELRGNPIDPEGAAITVTQIESKPADIPVQVDGPVQEKDLTKAEEPNTCGVCGTNWFGGGDVCPNEQTHPRNDI